VAKNAYWSYNAIDKGAMAIGDFNDDLLNSFLEVDGENESAAYALVLGKT
jgi:hypothetical protein